MGHPRGVKNLDDVISEIEGRLDEKDEVRELTIKSSRTIARLSGSAIQAMHRGQDVGTALQETREEILKLRSLLKDHPDLYHTGIVENAMRKRVRRSSSTRSWSRIPYPVRETSASRTRRTCLASETSSGSSADSRSSTCVAGM